MNELIDFAKSKRTTTFFRDEAILKIRMAYRIMEYLAPDSIFTPEVTQSTKNLMLQGEFIRAYEFVMEEVSQKTNTDLGCSSAYEPLQREAVELMEYLLPIYQKGCRDVKEQRRIKLLSELKELDS